MSTQQHYMNVIEAALLAAGRPLDLNELLALFEGDEVSPDRKNVGDIVGQLQEDWAERSLELIEVATGFRFQVKAQYARWMGRLWTERPPRYSRALLETLALIAYRQPVTRAEIEDVRGVAVSSSIVKTLMEREWIRVFGHRDVPGRPALYGTTREFLDCFGLKNLEDLPPLADIKDIDNLHADLFSGLEASGRVAVGEASQGDADDGATSVVVSTAPVIEDEDGPGPGMTAGPHATEENREGVVHAPDAEIPGTDEAHAGEPAVATPDDEDQTSDMGHDEAEDDSGDESGDYGVESVRAPAEESLAGPALASSPTGSLENPQSALEQGAGFTSEAEEAEEGLEPAADSSPEPDDGSSEAWSQSSEVRGESSDDSSETPGSDAESHDGPRS